jgi:uncharacterized protein YrrD
MSDLRVLSVEKDLKGMAVLNPTTGEKIGVVRDAIIDPQGGSRSTGWKSSRY